MDDFSLAECDATVVGVGENDGEITLVLDQTCVYPGGGGQACDLGEIRWNGGALHLTGVSKDAEGIVRHRGTLEGELPKAGETVHCKIDPERRLLNSRLHCVGHLLDYAVKKVGKGWQSGKSAHYPHMSFVEYDGQYDATEADELARLLETTVNNYIQKGGAVGIRMVPAEEAHNYSDYLPDAVLEAYQNVHLAIYPDNFAICCGGTHVTDVAQIGPMTVTRIKKKDGKIRISYALADEAA